jgi:hypothetical protein
MKQREATMSGAVTTSLLDIHKLYEDGKHRRYELLFAVNGGGYAIATLIAKGEVKHLGQLDLWWIATGMIAYTVIMGFDIYQFGLRMRGVEKMFQPGKDPLLFGWVGRIVLLLLCILIVGGWCLASRPAPT